MLTLKILLVLAILIAIYIDVVYFMLIKYCKNHENIIEHRILDLESLNKTIQDLTIHIDKNLNDYNKEQNDETLVKLNENINILERSVDSYRDKLSDLKYEIRDLYDHL